MIKKLLLFLCLFSVLIFSFALSAGAVYTPYSGVTDNSSAVKVLTDYYINSDDYKSGDDFIVMRISQTEMTGLFAVKIQFIFYIIRF